MWSIDDLLRLEESNQDFVHFLTDEILNSSESYEAQEFYFFFRCIKIYSFCESNNEILISKRVPNVKL